MNKAKNYLTSFYHTMKHTHTKMKADEMQLKSEKERNTELNGVTFL